MEGREIFSTFYANNLCVTHYFSKFETDLDIISNTKKPFLSKSIEFIFNTGLGEITDSIFKKITLKKWKAKFKFLNKGDFNIALKSSRNISQHHPSNFQEKVILAL